MAVQELRLLSHIKIWLQIWRVSYTNNWKYSQYRFGVLNMAVYLLQSFVVQLQKCKSNRPTPYLLFQQRRGSFSSPADLEPEMFLLQTWTGVALTNSSESSTGSVCQNWVNEFYKNSLCLSLRLVESKRRHSFSGTFINRFCLHTSTSGNFDILH